MLFQPATITYHRQFRAPKIDTQPMKMLKLFEPYRGCRFEIIRLIMGANIVRTTAESENATAETAESALVKIDCNQMWRKIGRLGQGQAKNAIFDLRLDSVFRDPLGQPKRP